MSGHSHRPTLKQSNKGFKSKHASKGSLKAAAKGKVSSSAHSHGTKNALGNSKKARLNANAQKRTAKRQAVIQDQKFFSTSSGGGHVPRIVSVVPLLPSISPRTFIANLLPSLGLNESELQEISAGLSDYGSYLLRAPRYKTSLQINLLPPLSVYPTLDAAFVSDYIVLLMSSVDEVQLQGETILRSLQGQVGGAEIVACVQAPESNPLRPDTRQLIHKSLLSFTRYFFPSVAKIYSSDTPQESLLLARALCEAAPKGMRGDDGRAYIVAENPNSIRWTGSGILTEDGQEKGQLEIIGTVRGGGTLNADRLVHIPGSGDYQVAAILSAPLPSKRQQTQIAANDTLSVPTEDADDLTATNIPDLLANEQTWPTEEEMAGSTERTVEEPVVKKRVKRVPKGTSAYQAAWIVDDDEEIDAEDLSDDESMAASGDEAASAGERSVAEDEEEYEDVEVDSRQEIVHTDLDPEQEEADYEAYLKERSKADREDAMFPDEVDTPRHIPARTRFQRYRGLKSFRTSPWDPYEDLPIDYAKIFQFENFAATSKRIQLEGAREGVKTGTRVILVLRDVPRSVIEDRETGIPFIVHGLLRHEHKQSVLHFVVQRNTEYTEPVKAKELLVLCVGPRRYIVRPLYSQHVRGGGKGANNVHKSEKFLRPGTATVMSIFGPICFGKSPCLLMKDRGIKTVPDLVAMGSFLSSDPTRIIAKRIILTGHPVKIHKKTATIRYMFFNREDIEYFKSVQLHTKYGKIGNIKESLGTHGYFKAHFDGPIQQMDTICMSLYKRQYPKWSEEFRPAQLAVGAIEEVGEDVMETDE
ncbi:pre-rRNA-processing protein TSR1 [Cryptococcus neoformans C23]|uniref:Pre-rRNA-processing protein TSR1 n=1 Tax=Cryptococcus neoformans (strain H99 / ATCC 208821 / CBS 10515 / FGSC 9487) TaxID=235443 RepID=J9VUX2_CRYN9|nr:pre-rRNA-processing protein TSR1 [Cryptococcus neoformans var. grubii H99]AFR95500.2 pre-rRNA-processing protein TSR1 [Cryptococcus neoformans var. grubii H99]AUB25310.1 pre-rRNA-processing protein TSR1 [Cryptococcus neoformans var. grubii]OWZ31573.1 pre-rRNA-processing protein TSR1 [Cryptococcus neoformans var. grubii AD2-60a]OWZ43734.1 pre-rRNA-processing protein TSR1 [Cryptococcus neoformans var. grubii C23]|eukprot:XP_012049756.1 pre-rRNA-processing protein TSR1 [Cryptococcus neoformans var. grubii H99]